jgi:hypothetical protein
LGRDFERVEHARLGRLLQVRHVGVPDGLAGAEAADRLAVRAEHVGDDVDFRMAGDEALAVLLHRREVEIAEAAAEGDEVGVGETLAAEEQDGMGEPGGVERGESGIVEIAEVDPGHFHPEAGAFAGQRCRCFHGGSPLFARGL